MRLLRWFALRRLLQRAARSALTVLVVGMALSPLVGVYIEDASVEHAMGAVGVELSGPAPLRVVGSTLKGGLPSDVPAQLRAIPEVGAVVPVVQAVTLIDGDQQPVVVVGITCADARLLGEVTCDPAGWDGAQAPFITSPGLLRSIGDRGTLRTTSGPTPLRSVTAVKGLASINGGRVLITGLGAAQHMFVRGDRLDVSYIVPRGGVSTKLASAAIGAALGSGVRVLEASDPPPGPDVSAPISALLAVLGLFAAAVGWFLVRSIGRLTLRELEPEIAVQRALGRSRSAILADLFVEACVLGGAGGLVAGLIGWGVGAVLVHALAGLVGDYTGTVPTAVFHPVVLLVTSCLGSALVVIAMSWSWWVTSRTEITRVTSAQQAAAAVEALPGRAGFFVGVIAVLVGLALSEVAVGPALLTVSGMLLAVTGLVLTLAGAFTVANVAGPRLLSKLADRAPRGSRVQLLVRNLSGHTRPLAAVVLSVTIAVMLAVALNGFEPAVSDASRSVTVASTGDRYAVNSVAFNDSTLLDAKIGPRTVARIGEATDAVVSRETYTLTRAESTTEIAVMASERPHFAYPTLVGDDTDRVVHDGRAAVGAPLARALDLRPGDRLSIDSPRGPVPITVGAVIENLNNAGMVAVVPMAVVDGNWGWQPPDPLIIDPSHPTTAAGLQAMLAPIDPNLQVADANVLAADTTKSLGEYFGPFNALRNCLFAVVALAACSALTLVAAQRRREYALLAAVGLTPTDLRAVAMGEAVLLATLGAAQGLLIGLLLVEPMRNLASFALGIRPGIHVSFAAIVATVAAAIGTVVIGALWPARRVAHFEIQTALQGE